MKFVCVSSLTAEAGDRTFLTWDLFAVRSTAGEVEDLVARLVEVVTGVEEDLVLRLLDMM